MSRRRKHDARINLLRDRIVDPRNDQIIASSPSSNNLRINIISSSRKRAINEAKLILDKKCNHRFPTPGIIFITSEGLRDKNQSA